MRLLVVGFTGSSHLAHRLALITELDWDVHVFPVDSDAPSSMLRDVTVYYPKGAQRDALHASVHAVELDTERHMRFEDHVDLLTQIVGELSPDLVHTEQFWPAAYMTYDAFERLGNGRPPWMASNWGPCISYFGRNEAHRSRVRAVIGECDYYTCECYRDLGLARAFGYRGSFLPVVPIAAHFDVAHVRSLRNPGPTSTRRTITLKGYEHFYGRAFVGLDALRRCSDLVAGYELALIGAMDHVIERARETCDETGMRLTVASGIDRLAPHEEILRTLGRSRLSVSLSTADGLCTSCFEAMAMGALPVQSNSSCADEWAPEGVGALYVDAEGVEELVSALRRGLVDDELVDRAATANVAMVEAHFDRDLVGRRYRELYRSVALDVAARERAAGGAGP